MVNGDDFKPKFGTECNGCKNIRRIRVCNRCDNGEYYEEADPDGLEEIFFN